MTQSVKSSTHRFASSRKGAETRLRIINVAIDLFGSKGYVRASTRAIAVAAGVNAPALQYYFGGKSGLYLACAEHVVAAARSTLDPMINEITAAVENETNIDRLIAAYCRLQTAFADFVFHADNSGKWSAFVTRDRLGLEGRDAFRSIRRKFGNRYLDLCASLIARITGLSPDHPDTLVRLVTIHAQLDSLKTAANPQLANRIVEEHTSAILRACARVSESRPGFA